jgi:hypothetical protein
MFPVKAQFPSDEDWTSHWNEGISSLLIVNTKTLANYDNLHSALANVLILI